MKSEIMDYELEDTPCPKCDHYPIHSRSCSELACESGRIDISEDDFLVEGSSFEKCRTCNGMGIERWCPKCGYDISENADNLAIDFGDMDGDDNFYCGDEVDSQGTERCGFQCERCNDPIN